VVTELETLQAEAANPASIRAEPGFTTWKAKVDAALVRAHGPDHLSVKAFRDIRYNPGVYVSGSGDEPFIRAHRTGVQQAVGLIEAAIYELKLHIADDTEPVDVRAYDPDLWDHVKKLVEDEEWGKVASQTAIFVEDRVRAWAGHPKGKDDSELVGKGLHARVFADDSEYRLGRTRSEWEGWRALGMGFAQAAGNVDRHRIQQRDDARRYAIGVLGLGSLLLTQLRYEHGDHLHLDG